MPMALFSRQYKRNENDSNSEVLQQTQRVIPLLKKLRADSKKPESYRLEDLMELSKPLSESQAQRFIYLIKANKLSCLLQKVDEKGNPVKQNADIFANSKSKEIFNSMDLQKRKQELVERVQDLYFVLLPEKEQNAIQNELDQIQKSLENTGSHLYRIAFHPSIAQEIQQILKEITKLVETRKVQKQQEGFIFRDEDQFNWFIHQMVLNGLPVKTEKDSENGEYRFYVKEQESKDFSLVVNKVLQPKMKSLESKQNEENAISKMSRADIEAELEVEE
jgi:hypothetical protein